MLIERKGMGWVQSYSGFIAARFFLGASEAGVFPGAIFYLSMWCGRKALVRRVTLFFTSTSLAGAFGGILAYGIGHMSGMAEKHGWFWIFAIEGIATVVIPGACFFLIQDFPAEAKFLSQRERKTLNALLVEDNDALRDESWSWAEVRRTFRDVKIWLYTIAWMGQALSLYTETLFLPTIIKNLGYSAANAQLLIVPYRLMLSQRRYQSVSHCFPSDTRPVTKLLVGHPRSAHFCILRTSREMMM